ncbi:MAG: LysR substrate-binding domain-containing protein [Verrucomicrobiota bacterium]|nr:LysR substrate-binding domain-containing protein [Limisphaera sp.]MDW8381238.1 LysR substrate-binding domain-containing protein [Verrucomicrobiota bacterium]
MELHQLRYFVTVVEAGGFSRAAVRLHVAQPSLSQQIAKLEQELGQPLLDRLPRGVVPTEAGRRLYDRARRILAEVADATRCVADCRESLEGRLVVGAIPTIAPGLLPRLLAEFSEQHPKVDVQVVEEVTERLLQRLDEGQIDLALASTVDVQTAIHCEPLGKEPLGLLLPARHALARRRQVTWTDLQGEKALVLSELHCLARQVNEFCKTRSVRWHVWFQAAHLGTILEMVANGVGVSLVPQLFAPIANARGCRWIPLDAPRPERDINLLLHNLRYRTRATLAFAALVRRAAQRLGWMTEATK